MIHPGDIVKCIDSSFSDRLLAQGMVYRVIDVTNGMVSLGGQGIPYPWKQSRFEKHFSHYSMFIDGRVIDIMASCDAHAITEVLRIAQKFNRMGWGLYYKTQKVTEYNTTEVENG